MSRQRRQPHASAPFGTVVRGGARDRLKDAGSKELATLARKLGNDRVQTMLAQATGKRDALLDFIRQRLAQVKVAQQAEVQAMARDRVWFDEVARGKKGHKLPDPTRWRGPAVLYKKAIQALCAGDVGRGAQLLDDAVEAERAAFDSMPEQVPVPSATTKPEGAPDERVFVEAGESAPLTHAPDALAAADAIIKVSDRSAEQPMPRAPRQHRGWWEQEPEEETKKDEKKGGAKGAPARTEAAPTEERARDEEKAREEEEKTPERETERAREKGAEPAKAAETAPARGRKKKP